MKHNGIEKFDPISEPDYRLKRSDLRVLRVALMVWSAKNEQENGEQECGYFVEQRRKQKAGKNKP